MGSYLNNDAMFPKNASFGSLLSGLVIILYLIFFLLPGLITANINEEKMEETTAPKMEEVKEVNNLNSSKVFQCCPKLFGTPLSTGKIPSSRQIYRDSTISS